MQTILVPTDFSLNANKALNYAAEVAKLSGAKIIIMHVTNLTHATINENVALAETLDNEVFEDANKQLDILVTATRETTGGPVEQQMYNGFVTDAIQEAAEENKVDIIIMGTLGNSGVREKLFGSITASLISHVHIPLLAVPLMYEWQPPKNILLAINHFKESPQVLQPMLKLAEVLKAPVHVSAFTNEDSAEAADYLQNRRDIELFCVNMQQQHPELIIVPAPVYGHHFEEAIKNYISNNETGLLVMITHKRNFIESIFNRSLTKKMSYHTDIPLLSIPIHS
ncbi:MAG: universal stress protein [Chitinophagaceae bacterium]|nr:MAG: universal stress protein [Chitinophagaceae bacterium]